MRKIVCLLFVIFFATTCKKYPENKFSEFVNPRKVLEGQWYFNGYFVNDADSTLQHLKVFNLNASNPNSITMYVSQSGNNKDRFTGNLLGFNMNYIQPNCSCVTLLISAEIKISLTSKKKELLISFGNFRPNFFTSEEHSGNWKIRKLTKKEFIIENELYKKYRVEFIK